MVHFIGQKTLFFYILPFEVNSSFAIFTNSGLGISSASAATREYGSMKCPIILG